MEVVLSDYPPLPYEFIFLSEDHLEHDSNMLQTTPIHTWVGVVAEDKDPNSVSIEVVVPELVPALTGTVGSSTTTQSVSIQDIEGNQINTSIKTKTTVTAIYYGNNTNRTFPPDVVKGEQVRILKFANADRYYWESMGRDDGLRKTETIRWSAQNRQNFDDPNDDAHTYSFTIDTKRNQQIRLASSKGNGENFAYTLLIDTKNSKVQLQDDQNNSILIDSTNSKILARNNKGAFLLLNGLDAVFAAPRDLTLKAGRQMVVTSPLISIANTESAGILAINSKEIAINASSDFVLTAPAIGLNGAVKIPEILAVNNLRAMTTAGTSAGSAYSPASINMTNGTGAAASNSPDTTMPSGQRHATAYEQFNAAMSIVVSCFDAIQGKIGVPTTQGQISILQPEAEMNNLTGV
jgi:hypothetical protein